MKSRLLSGLCLALPLFIQTAPAAAVDHPCEGKMPPPMHGPDFVPGHEPVPPFLHGIKLNENQKDGIFKLMHEQAPSLREKMKKLQQSREALLKLPFNESFDEGQARQLAETAARAESEISLLRLRIDQHIYLLLSPEQRAQLRDGKNSR